MRTENLSQHTSADQQAAVITTVGPNGQKQMGVLAQDLMTELMGVVPVLGERKVVVGFAGTGAFCDKALSYVNIPSLPPAKVLPLAIAQEIRGFAAHEAAHLAFTDPTVEIVDDNGEQNSLLHTIWNCIEDYMIERDWLELYPGARKNFAATEARCCRGYLEGYTQDPDVARDLRRVGPVALTWLRAMHFGLGTQASRDCFQTLDGGFQTRVMGWFQDIMDVETTQDCLDAAKEIYADIDADPIDPLNPPRGAGGSGNGQGSGSGKGSSSGAATQQDVYTGPKPLPTGSQLQQVLDDQGLSSNEMVSAQVDSSATSGPYAEILGDSEGYTIAQAALSEIQGEASAISMHLRRALTTAGKTRFKSGRQDGMIDPSRIAVAQMGGLDYHKRKVKGEIIDTALSILVDCSGSMGGGSMQVCQQMSLALESALSGTLVKHEIVGFTTASEDQADDTFKTMVAANQANGGDAHFRAIGMYEFRKFGQSYNTALMGIGNMTRAYMGGTPTGDAMLLAHDRLARRKERRHVMMVLTDGCSDDAERVQQAVDAISACNVTVIGVGICSDHVQDEFENHVVINDIKDLPAVMMSKITKLLLGDKKLTALNGASAKKKRQRAA